MRDWVVALGNKKNTNATEKDGKKKKKKGKETWEDQIDHEYGMVTSDLGCSFHGENADGTLNINDMIGYLAKGDGLQLVNWPDKTVTMDQYGYDEPQQSDLSGPVRHYRGTMYTQDPLTLLATQVPECSC